MSNTRKRKHGGLTQDGETRIKVERSLSSSDSDEELSSPSYASFLHGDRKPVYSDVVWKQMEKMGYKAGESLGKTGLGNKQFSVTKNQGNDSEDEVLNNASQPESVYSDFAQRQMESMGFQQGGGLGRFGQGRADIIEASQQRGRRGLGFRVEGFDDKDFTWEEEEEVVIVEPKVCIPSCPRPPPTKEEMEDWIRIAKKKLTIDDEAQFCSEEVLAEVLKSKTVFDALSGDEFLKARTRANPYEFIRGAIFQNRAAMKMANMDSAFDFMFTSPKDDKGRDLIGPNDLLYFADLCAGPGGFSEYVLWRKGWQAKGFGFTLRGDNDFKLEEFLAGTPETFEPHYGVHDDGDIYNEDNLVEFRRHVLELTDDKGVHFVMADGGFSVAGQENIQEILSKQLYLCQFLCAVSILRTGGHFVCKLFDLFTSFSVGLVYLMYRIFDEVYIFKPVTSRPANSERYVVCKGLRPNIQDVLEHMFNANVRINKMKNQDIDDVMEIVPLHILLEDEEFSSYMVDSNDRIGKVQANSLKKLRAYVQDTTLMGHYDQGEVKKRCLETWKIPEKARAAPKNPDPDVKFDELWKGIDDDHCFDSEPTTLTSKNIQNLKCLYNYKCFVSGGERWFFMGLGRSNIYKWDGKPNYRSSTRWHKLENFHLELPRDTLIEVEIVQELRGEGKGQRRSAAVHIVDAVILGGKDVRNLHYSERMAKAGLLVKAVNKPTCQGMVPLRLKHIFRVDSSSLKEIFTSRIDMKVVKGKSREPRECFMLEDGRHLLPKGIFFIKRIQAGLSTGGEDLRRRLEQVENRKSYKEITCDVAKCGSRKESRNNSNVPARITCIPHSITEERHLISDFYVKPIETIQSCQEVTSGCQRFPRMYTYYPHTTFNRTIDVGVCAGSCGNQLSCRPVWTNQKAIATPNGERLIPVIKSCSCVTPYCYRVAKYEAFAELYTDDQGKNATRTKLVDMGHCESERMCPFSKRGLPTSCGFQLKYISILSAAGSYTTVAPVKRCTCGD